MPRQMLNFCLALGPNMEFLCFATMPTIIYYRYMNIQELLKIAGEQGKVVIVDAEGSIQGVYLDYVEYQKLTCTSTKGAKPSDKLNEQIERINREILQAQLEEVTAPVNLPTTSVNKDDYIDPVIADVITNLLDDSNFLVKEAVVETQAINQSQQQRTANSLNELLSKRAETLFGNYPGPSAPAPKVEIADNDLRAEVMDPNFDYGDNSDEHGDEAVDDETIRPNFDDI